MIGRLRGRLFEKKPGQLIVDVSGVGYRVFVAMPTYSATPDPGAEIALDIHTHVREDAIQLYGFATGRERSIFERLTEISGIGPRLALTILSGSSVDDLIGSIKRGDLARLTSIPGVGKKTAERILLELRDKLKTFEVAGEKTGSEVDVVSAMENLGYNRALVEGAIRRALDGSRELDFDELFKRTLQILTRG
jgi:Holliday junction DNA helicase RuvA